MPYATKIGVLDGNGWEQYAHRFLRRRYQGDIYQTVPSRFQGDLGLESFTLRTGLAFQCYYPEEDYPAKELYNHQRDKISTDIRKLTINERSIREIVGNRTIREWHFITPVIDHKDLLKHARKKEAEVRALKLKHVDPDFTIVLGTESDYEPEIQQLFKMGMGPLCVVPPDPSQRDLTQWSDGNNRLFNNLEKKARQIHPEEDVAMTRFIWGQIKAFLIGQHILEAIRRDAPQLFAKFIRLKDARERKVTLCTGGRDAPGMVLLKAIEEYEKDLDEEFRETIERASRLDLALWVASDWLLRCPLNFPRQR